MRETDHESLDRARDLNNLGLKAWERGELTKARQYYCQALEIRRRVAQDSLDLVESLNRLGDVEEQLGDLGKAEKYASDALALGQALAPDSLVVAQALNRLGSIAADRGNLASAEEYLQRAFDIRKKLAPGSRAVALSLIALGNLAGRRGDGMQEEEYFHRAQDLGDKLAFADHAAIFDGLGDASINQGNLETAEQYFRQALEIRQKLLPEGLSVAVSLSKLGSVSSNRGDPEQAEAYFRQALAIRQKLLPDSLSVAASLVSVGNISQARGNLVEAERCFRHSLSIQEQIAPDSLAEASSLQGLGVVFWGRDDLSKAEDYFHRAIEITQRLAPGSPDLAQNLNWLGLVYARHGELNQAEEYFHQALSISEKLSPEGLLVSQMFKDLGDLAERRGDLSQADQDFRHALTIQDKVAHDGVAEAFTMQKLGDLARMRSDPAEAEKYFRQALTIWQRKVPGSLAHVQTLLSLASLLHQEHQRDAASQLYAEAISVLDNEMAQIGGTDGVRSIFRAKYEGYFKDYIDLLVSQKQPELAFDVVEHSRARTLLELLQSAQIDIQNGCDPQLLRREHSLRELISAKSSYRLRLLDQGGAGEELAALEKQIGELKEQYEEVRTQIQLGSPAYAALAQPQPLSAREVQSQLLDTKTILLEYSLGEQRSYVWVVTKTSLAVYVLPSRNIIEDAARNVYELLTARGHHLTGETATQRGMRLARAEAEYSTAAADLSRMVLGPVAALLEKKRLLIVSDGALQYLPFAVLPVPQITVSARSFAQSNFLRGLARRKNMPLVVEHEIVNLPSASALAELRRTRLNRKEPPRVVAVFADPVYDLRDERVTPSRGRTHDGEPIKIALPPQSDGQSLSVERLTRSAADVGLVRERGAYLGRLLWTEREAAAILSVTPAGRSLKALGFQANRATALSPALARYRIIHFATHAILDSKNPELSGLVLSMVNKYGQPQNGFLDLEQIFNLNLPVDLVVLSACDTALGQEIRGEGLIGLARGFMYAGASRVMASLWDVDDEVTSELMARFYKALEQERMSPAAALRTAQIEVAKHKRWSAPYYWAAFEIQGEWK